MRIHRLFLNRLDGTNDDHDIVVVIDVLRSFTTAAYAFAAGARAVFPVETVSAAWRLKAQLPEAITTGALPGGDPVPDFDFGNTPTAFADLRLDERPLIQSTAAGVRGLARFCHARALFAGSLVCAHATAAAIAELDPQEVTFVITGEWVDRDGDEDIACADYLDALLRGECPAPESFEQRVRESDFGRRFGRPEYAHLPISDLALCARADRFDFAMRAIDDGKHLQLQRSFIDH